MIPGTPLLAPGAGGVFAGLDPRSRLIGAAAGVLAISLLTRPMALAAALALGLVAAGLARLPVRALVRRLAHLEAFLILLLLILPLTAGGPALGHIGPVGISAAGVERALALIVRINAAALVLAALLATLEPTRIGAAAARLKAPAALVTLFLLTVRYAALFGAESRRLGEAMRVRGFVPRASRHGWVSLGHLVGRLLVNALERAERVTEAMRCRGWSGRMPVTDRPPFTGRDLLFAALAGPALALLLALDRLPGLTP